MRRYIGRLTCSCAALIALVAAVAPAAGASGDPTGAAASGAPESRVLQDSPAAVGAPAPAAHRDYEVTVGGLVQADARAYPNDRDRNTVLLRRARPIVTGTVLDLVDFNFTADFGGGQVGLVDAYLNVRPEPWLQLRVGKFKPPIGLERLQSDASLPLPERALTSNLTATRDVGAQLWGSVGDGMFTYALAILDGAPDNGNFDQDVGGHKDLAGRIFFEPFHALQAWGTLGLGLAATAGLRDGDAGETSLASFRSPGQVTMFTYLAPADDPDGELTVYASGLERRLNAQLYYYYRGLGVLGESVWARERLARGELDAVLLHFAAHLTASYVIGGTNGFKGATPNSEWNPAVGAFGAVELAIRVATIALDDDTFPNFADPATSVHGADNIGGAVNWVLSRQLRVAASFEHTRFEGGAPGGNRPDENFVLTRAQLAF